MNSVADVAVLVLTLAVVLALVAMWLAWTAGRLDRLHLRLETARASLDTQLARRAGLAAELASTEAVDPASALLLLEASGRARAETGPERWQAESELTEVLRHVGLPEPGGDPLVADALVADPQVADPLLADLDDAARRAGMARRIHNDLAVATRAMHDRRRVRWFRLAGRAERPELVEFDDRPLA
jgi:hypothetical protein